jgi:hypothetical protein
MERFGAVDVVVSIVFVFFQDSTYPTPMSDPECGNQRKRTSLLGQSQVRGRQTRGAGAFDAEGEHGRRALQRVVCPAVLRGRLPLTRV